MQEVKEDLQQKGVIQQAIFTTASRSTQMSMRRVKNRLNNKIHLKLRRWTTLAQQSIYKILVRCMICYTVKSIITETVWNIVLLILSCIAHLFYEELQTWHTGMLCVCTWTTYKTKLLEQCNTTTTKTTDFLPVIKVNMNSAGSDSWLQVLQERLHR